MRKTVSIIVPVYNTKEYLKKCFDSVCSQTYTDWELIIVDDGSNDSSAEFCDGYAKGDDRIVVVHQENRGNIAARKSGLNRSKGTYISFLDSDDWLESDAIACMYNYMETEQVDAVFLSCYKDNNDVSMPYNHMFEPGVYSCDKDLVENMFYYKETKSFGVLPLFHGKLFKREKIEKCFQYIPNEIQFAEDRLTMFWMILNSNKIYLGNENIYHYVSRRNSIMNSVDESFLIKINYFFIAVKQLFESREERDILLRQLDTYMVDAVLAAVNHRLGLFQKNLLAPSSFPYFAIPEDSEIVLYGAGIIGKKLYNEIATNKYCKILAWVDKNFDKYIEAGLSVQSVDYLQEVSDDVKIVVGIKEKDIFLDVQNDLCEMGIKRENIVWYKGMFIG